MTYDPDRRPESPACETRKMTYTFYLKHITC
jgi:hypothetical protein